MHRKVNTNFGTNTLLYNISSSLVAIFGAAKRDLYLKRLCLWFCDVRVGVGRRENLHARTRKKEEKK